MKIKFAPTKDFPYLKLFKQDFPVDKNSIFVLKDTIYSDKPQDIPYDIIYHEMRHMKQQNEVGEKVWVDLYLSDHKFRLKMEIDAYRYQIKKAKEVSNNDREELNNIRQECIKNLTSGFYGIKMNYPEAVKALKI